MEMGLHISLKILFFIHTDAFGKPWYHELLPGWIIFKVWKQDTRISETNKWWYRLLDVVSWWSTHTIKKDVLFKALIEVLWPLVLRSLPLPGAFYKSRYLEVIAVLHYNKHDDVIHASVSKACVSSKWVYWRHQACGLYCRHICILVFLHVFPCSMLLRCMFKV